MRHNEHSNKIVLFPGISVDELTALIQSLFAVDCAIIGLRGEVNPLSAELRLVLLL